MLLSNAQTREKTNDVKDIPLREGDPFDCQMLSIDLKHQMVMKCPQLVYLPLQRGS